MKTRILASLLFLNLYSPLHAQTDFSGALAPFMAEASAIPVPVPAGPAPEDSAVPAASRGVLDPVWSNPSRLVCKLTGTDSHNFSGTNAQVRGTDLGSMFEHKGKTYFIFGDTSIVDPVPANHLSNFLAYTSDTDASDCIDLHYITMRDLFRDVADFYAKESNFQAEEEISEHYDIEQDISYDYDAHYNWARTVSRDISSAELVRKAGRIFNYYAVVKNSRTAMADYYARLAVRLANFGISFADDMAKPSTRNLASYQAHYNWALGAPMSEVNRETKLRFDKLFTAVDHSRVKQIFTSKTFPGEYTAIGTNGVSINGRIYIYFMSVKSWTPWTTNYAGIAYSDDDGHTFTRVDGFFPGNSNFVQVALVKHEGYLYLFGIPAGRAGGVKLARVPVNSVLDKSAYRYCNMLNGSPVWVSSEAEASVIVPGPVGELSVQWNAFLDSWLMFYLNDKDEPADKRHWIEARTAPALDGVWSREKFVVAPIDFSSMGGFGIYGPYMQPVYTAGNGETVYFLLSMWSHYNTFLLEATLTKPADAASVLMKAAPAPATGAKIRYSSRSGQ